MKRKRGILSMSNSSANTWESSVELFNRISLQTIDLYKELSNSTVKILDYSENSTYLVHNPEVGEKYILRVCRPNYLVQRKKLKVKYVGYSRSMKIPQLSYRDQFRARQGVYPNDDIR